MPACCHFSDLAESYEYSPAITAVKGPTCPNQTPHGSESERYDYIISMELFKRCLRD